MKKKILWVCFLCMGLSTNVFGQLTLVELKTQYSALGNTPYKNRNPNTVLDMRLRETRGTPYIQKDWLPGTVYLKSGMKREHVLINYDVVEDKPIFQGEQGGDIYISPRIVDYFVMQNEDIQRVFQQFPHPKKKNKFLFMELLELGKVSLFIRRRRYFVPADYSNSAYNAQLNAEYKILPDKFYMIKEGDNKMYKLPKRRGAILKLLKDQKASLKAYLDEQEIYGPMENLEILNAVKYYNSLNE